MGCPLLAGTDALELDAGLLERRFDLGDERGDAQRVATGGEDFQLLAKISQRVRPEVQTHAAEEVSGEGELLKIVAGGLDLLEMLGRVLHEEVNQLVQEGHAVLGLHLAKLGGDGCVHEGHGRRREVRFGNGISGRACIVLA